MDVAYLSDIAEAYSKKRNGVVTKKQSKELLEIMVKYINKRLKSNDFYAIDLCDFGVLYKHNTLNEILDSGRANTKEKKLMEKQLIQKLYGEDVKPEYTHNEIEIIEKITNNHPIKI